MKADKVEQIKAHAQASAELLYEETDPEQVKTLEGIEESVRKHREILDWYHLVENLGKVGGSIKRLDRVEAWLWKGRKALPVVEDDVPLGYAERNLRECAALTKLLMSLSIGNRRK